MAGTNLVVADVGADDDVADDRCAPPEHDASESAQSTTDFPNNDRVLPTRTECPITRRQASTERQLCARL
jgi:hypothetical protein